MLLFIRILSGSELPRRVLGEQYISVPYKSPLAEKSNMLHNIVVVQPAGRSNTVSQAVKITSV